MTDTPFSNRSFHSTEKCTVFLLLVLGLRCRDTRRVTMLVTHTDLSRTNRKTTTTNIFKNPKTPILTTTTQHTTLARNETRIYRNSLQPSTKPCQRSKNVANAPLTTEPPSSQPDDPRYPRPPWLRTIRWLLLHSRLTPLTFALILLLLYLLDKPSLLT